VKAVDDPAARELVERQARSWERSDFELGAADWAPGGVLQAPGVTVPFERLGAEMAHFHELYCDLEVEIKNVFTSRDGGRIAIEWDWAVSRRSDGQRSVTNDAIIVDLVDGKIASWREYFDPATGVEAQAQ
jgi:ketosteroid isomerase-like protein